MGTERPFNSFAVEEKLPSGKTIFAQVIEGKCILNNKIDAENKQTFSKKYFYPSDGIPDDIKELSAELQRIVESVNNFTIDIFQLVWGVNDEEIPYLIQITDAKFQPKSNIQKHIENSLVFVIDQMTYTHKKNACYKNDKNCTECLFKTDKIMVTHLFIADYLNTMPENIRDGMTQNIIDYMNRFSPNLIKGSCTVCPLCFKRISKELGQTQHGLERITNKQNTFFKTQTAERCYHKTSRPQSAINLRTSCRSQSLSSRSPSKASTSNISMATLGSTSLRLTQNISMESYKKAHRVYSSKSNVAPFLHKPRK